MDFLEGSDCCFGCEVSDCAKCLCCLCNSIPGNWYQSVDQCCASVCGSFCGACGTCWSHCLCSHGTESSILNCKVSAAAVLLTLLLIYSIILSALSLFYGFQWSLSDCETPLSLHLIIQGFGIFAIFGLFLRIWWKFSFKPKLDRENEGMMILGFWKSFKSDCFLTILTFISLFTFCWAFLGFQWLSQANCDSNRPEFSVDSIGAVSVVLFLSILAGLVLVLFIVISCDEGSCELEGLGTTCFMCCCLCCLKQSVTLQYTLNSHFRQRRTMYPEHRTQCLKKILSAVVFLGCLHPEYSQTKYEMKKDESVVQELTTKVVPEVGAPATIEAESFPLKLSTALNNAHYPAKPTEAEV